jgi:hypothetical protein
LTSAAAERSGKGSLTMPMLVLADELNLDVPCLSYRHNPRFLEVIGVTDLGHAFYNKIHSKHMDELTAVLNSTVAPGRDLRDIIWVFVFAHGAGCSDKAVTMDSTHAVSVFSRTADGIAHRYFERDGGIFSEVFDLAVTVRAMPNLDDIRLLHFAVFALGELPSQSMIYEFKAEYWGVEHELRRSDHTLRAAVLLKAERLAGAPTIGLNGDEVYTALLQRAQDGEEANCGNSTSCSAGTGSCETVPPKDSAGFYCRKGDSGDAWVSVFTEAIQTGLVSLEEVDFPTARAFITDFLPRSQRGRRLMAHYYAGSPTVRGDRTALEEYVRALPSIRASLRELLHGPDDAIVGTEDVRDAFARFAALHEDVRVPVLEEMDIALRQVEWGRLTTKADVRRLLEGDEPNHAATEHDSR